MQSTPRAKSNLEGNHLVCGFTPRNIAKATVKTDGDERASHPIEDNWVMGELEPMPADFWREKRGGGGIPRTE